MEQFIKYDYIFETILKPLRSKSARKIYTTFLEHSDVEYLTTFDIQKELQSQSIKLSKKEINAWLMSLKLAGLIIKEETRGKPSTLIYEKKYTFDKWRLTERGVYLAGDLDTLNISYQRGEPLNAKISESYTPFKQNDPTFPYDYYVLTFLRRLIEVKALISEGEIAGYLLPSKNVIKQVISECLTQNYITGINAAPLGLLQRVLARFGFGKRSVYYELTEEGRSYIKTRKLS
jgi:DNA-binding PadR family transcriptional regulator